MTPIVRPRRRNAPLLLTLLIVLVASAAVTLLSPSARAQELGSIEGRVLSESGGTPDDVTVTLVELRRRASVSEEGAFRFDAVPPGRYLVLAESASAGSGVARVEVSPGEEIIRVEIPLELTSVSDELIVTGTTQPRRQLDVAQPTAVLGGEELAERREATLGETLDEQPGVSSTYFGPGASRPVIRGIGGERVQILRQGIGSADVSNTSPDHAVAADTQTAERIEVLRGPATLLYGSTAVGGVVNVLDGRIPDYVPERTVSGSVETRAGSVADERAGTVSLEGGLGRLAWHVDYANRDTGDYEIPGRAELTSEDEHEEDGHHEGEEHDEEGHAEESGILENSSLETESAGVGLSWVGEHGFLGVSVNGFDTNYGVPGHAHAHGGAGEEHGHEGEEEHGHEEDHEGEDGHEEGHEGEDGEEAVRIDLEQRRVDLRGEMTRDFGPFRGLKVRAGVTDYEHVELEGTEVGTRFENDGVEGRLELVQRPRGRLTGSVGVQYVDNDFVAAGAEAFVPPSTTEQLAVFAFEELDFGRFRLQVGGRWESQEVVPESAAPRRSFDGLSGSVGGVWDLTDAYALALNLARTERLPTATELYADGPHLATQTFEIGDPGLGDETSLGLDLSLRKRSGRVTGSVNLFSNRFDDYIFEQRTGGVEDGLEVVELVQRDAEFYGVEVSALVDLYEGRGNHLALDLSGDFVQAELRETGEPLPRIPPLSLGAGLRFHRESLRALAEVRWVDQQDDVAPNETSTDGYTLVNASIGYRFMLGAIPLDVSLRGRNLTDEEARVHTSFLKDRAPLPGRDVSLGLRIYF